MFQRILVPVDGSQRSLNAVRFGAAIAAECDADLEVVTVTDAAYERASLQADTEHAVGQLGPLVVQPKIAVLVGNSVAAALEQHEQTVEGTMVVMASTGRGRSASVLGSVADELLNRTFGPLIVVGPHATDPGPIAGALVVPVDGSKFSETSLGIAGAWGIGFGGTPWIVQVLTHDVPASNDRLESSYVARLAHDLGTSTHHPVEYEVLHGASPAKSIVDFTSSVEGRLIVMSSHGRTGLQRLTVGSIAAGVIHHATCPVVLHRPPQLQS